MHGIYAWRITILCLLVFNADMGLVTHSSVTKWLFKRQASECFGADYLLCSNGEECLQKDKLCDSVVDCSDKSDESVRVCQALLKGKCRDGEWRCAYGACVQESQHCDQNEDCWDGSDEVDCPQLSNPTELQVSSITVPETSATTELQTPTPSFTPCVVPASNSTTFYYWMTQLTRLESGSSVQNSDVILISCDPEKGFILEAGRKAYSICNNGEWTPKISKCSTCGSSSLETQSPPFFANGDEAEQEYFPWNAGIYYWKKTQWQVICAGTLITQRVVLTASHCVSFFSKEIKIPEAVDREDLSVSLGKYHCDWDSVEETEQRFEVRQVALNPNFRTGGSTRTGDIALLLLDHDAELNTYVMPACIDYGNAYTVALENNKSLTGYIAGWNINHDSKEKRCVTHKGSDSLQYSRLPVLSRQVIYDILATTKKSLAKFVYDDLFVVRNGSDAPLYVHDFGGGLTIPFQNRHYVFGVYVNQFTFKRNTYGTFINVSHHMQWLRNQLDLWSRDGS